MKKLHFIGVILLTCLLNPAVLQAATYTASATGNWSSAATWTTVNTNRTGTVSITSGTKTVTGSGTSFLTELSIGSVIATQGGTAIGTVASITSNTSLTIVSNAASTVTNQTYRTTDGPGGSADNVTLNNGVTLTVDVAGAGAALVNMAGGASNSALTVGAAGTLSITGTLTINSNSTGSTTYTITNSGTLSAGSILVNAASGGTTTVAMNGNNISVSGSFTFMSIAGGNSTYSLSGSSTVSCGSVILGSTAALAPGSLRTFTLTSTITGITSTGDLTFNAWQGSNTSRRNDPTLTITSGTWDIGGTITANNETSANISTLTLGNSSPVLKIGGATPFSITAGTFNRTFNGTGATVEYDGTTQSVFNTSYTNLVLSGGGTKTLAGTTTVGTALTVNGSIFDLSTFGLSSPSTTIYTGAAAASEIAGSSTLTLGGNVTILDANAGSNGAVISSAVALTNGSTRTFTVADNAGIDADLTVSGLISTTGGITKLGSGKMVLSNSGNSYSGTTTISTGKLSISADGHLGNTGAALTLSGGTLEATGVGTITLSATRAFSLTAPSTIDIASGTIVSYAGSVSGSSALTKSNSGELTLAGNNSLFTGGITLSSGKLNIKSASALGTGTFTIGNGTTIDNTSGSTLALSTVTPQAWTGNFTFTGTNDLDLGSGAVTITNSPQITVTANNLTVGGALSGTAITKLGASGALTLGGSNGSYSGGISLSAGTLNIKSAAALGTGTFTIAGGTTINNTSGGSLALSTVTPQAWTGNFTFTGTDNLDLGTGAVTITNSPQITITANNLTVGGALSGTTFTKLGASGALTVGGSNGSYSGGISLSAGTLNIKSATALGTGTLTIANGTTIDNTSGSSLTVSTVTPLALTGNFTFTGTNNLDLGTGAVTITNSPQVTVTANNLTIGGALSGTAITKLGASGALTVGGSNGSYSGGISLSAGTLNIKSAAALGTGTFTIANGTTIDNTSGSALTVSTVTPLALTGNFTFTGTNNLDLGTGAVTITNSPQITVTANNLTISGALSGTTITKLGASGALTLGGSSGSYTGGITLSAGTLNIKSAAALGTGTFTIASGTTINNTSGSSLTISTVTPQAWSGNFTFTGTNDLNLGTGAVTMSNTPQINVTANTLTAGGIISGTSFTKTGAGIFSATGNNTYSGTVNLNNGTLNLGSDNALGSTSNTLVFNGGTLAAAADITLSASRSMTMTGAGTIDVSSGKTLIYAGSISGTGVLSKTNSGTLTLGGSNGSFSGGVTVSAGTLKINSATAIGTGTFTIASGATIDAGSAITLSTNNAQSWNGNFTFAGSNNLNLGTGAITITSNLQVTTNSTATLTVGGTINAASYNFTKAGTGTLSFGSHTISLNNLSISGGTLTSTSGSLNITGDFTNAGGTFTHNSGTVTFNKSGAQSIGTATFNNLTLSGSGTKTASGDIGVAGTLDIPAGLTMDMSTYDLSGTLTASGTGVLKTSSGNTTALPSGRTWTMDVQFVGDIQYAPAGTFATLTNNCNVVTYMAGSATVATLNLLNGALRTTDDSSNPFNLTITSSISRTGGSISSPSGTVIFNNSVSDLTIPVGTFGSANAISVTGGKKAILASGYGTSLSIDNLTTSTSGSYFAINGERLTLTGTVSMAANTGISGGSTSTLVVGSGSTTVNLGTLRFDQTTPGTTNSIFNFTINNTGGGSLTLGDTMRVVNTFQPPTSGSAFTFSTGNKLILQSRSTGTARVATIASGTLSFSGNTIAERFVKNKTDKRRYVFVASPVDNISIRDAWQDDIFITAPGTGGTPCGTTTGNGVASTDKYNNLGYDATTANLYTIYTYSQVNGWQGVGTNTTTTMLSKGIGYRVLYRGSRGTNDANCASLLNSNTPNLPDSAIMNVSGPVTTGDVTVNLYGPGASTYGYTLLGNPYPSEISWTKFRADNPKVENMYYTHDPNSSTTTGYLAYSAGTVTGSSSNNSSGVINSSTGDFIASGQAFLVRVKNTNFTGSGYQTTAVFKETQKSTEQQLGVFRGTGTTSDSVIYNWKNMIRLNFATAGDTYIDDVVVRYSSDSSITTAANGPLDVNTLNSGDYVATMKSTFSYAIQTRPILFTNDTVPVRVVSSVTGNFKLRFSEYEHFDSAAQILLIDAFTGATTDIKQNPTYAFTITNDANSQGANRFKLVFRTLTSVMPVGFLSVSAKAKNDGAVVSWKMAFEQKVRDYTVERSVDGKNFAGVGVVVSKGDSNAPVEYSFMDVQPVNGTVYYRVKSTEVAGAVTYSSIVNLNGSRQSLISVYPNPAKDQLTVTLNFTDRTGAHAEAVIRNIQGKVVSTQYLAGFNGNYPLDLRSLAGGIYVLSVTLPDGTQAVSKFVKQ